MDENLQRMTRALRGETCPASVHAEVARRIAAEKAAAGRFRPAWAFAIAMVVILGCLAVWRWPVAQPPEPQFVAQPTLTSEQVVAQAEHALASIGCILLEAGAHSRQMISEEAVPPLRNSLDNTKNKLSQLINVTL